MSKKSAKVVAEEPVKKSKKAAAPEVPAKGAKKGKADVWEEEDEWDGEESDEDEDDDEDEDEDESNPLVLTVQGAGSKDGWCIVRKLVDGEEQDFDTDDFKPLGMVFNRTKAINGHAVQGAQKGVVAKLVKALTAADYEVTVVEEEIPAAETPKAAGKKSAPVAEEAPKAKKGKKVAEPEPEPEPVKKGKKTAAAPAPEPAAKPVKAAPAAEKVKLTNRKAFNTIMQGFELVLRGAASMFSQDDATNALAFALQSPEKLHDLVLEEEEE